MRNVDNGEDILDSRDVIARRDELEEERDALEHLEACEKREGTFPATVCADGCPVDEWDAENAEELRHLDNFIDEGGREWRHGETLVRESYFEDYAREVAEDLRGSEMRAAAWPFSCIDWERAASDLQQDYTGADFDGVTYYYRS